MQWARDLATWNALIVVAIAILAAGIRFWNLGSLGYTHWDEYYFLRDAEVVGQIWPRGFGRLGWYTTPLVAMTDGTLFHFLGVHTWIPMSVSALYGTASAVAIYLLGSRLFDRPTGLIASIVVATAEYSVMFSRMALAEATFTFWLILSVLFIWLGFKERRLVFYVLGGIASGLVLNSKYDGLFPLVLAVSWVIAEFGIGILQQPADRAAMVGQYRIRFLGTGLLVVIAIALFAPFLVKVAIWPGLETVLTHHESNIGNSLIKTSPTYVYDYFWLFTSPPTLLLCLAGIVVGAVRFTRADRLLLLYTVGWLVAVMLFPPFPREAMALLPAVAIWAGRAVVEGYALVRRRRPGRVALATTAVVVCVAAIAVGNAIPTVRMLSLQTLGYRQAAAVVASYQSEGRPVFMHAQAVALLYVHDELPLEATSEVEALLNQKGTSAVLMTDQVVSWHPEIAAFFSLNKDRVKVLQRVPNPMYDEVLLQPANDQGLANLGDPPDEYRYITFWGVTDRLEFPASWPR